jgi:hypothetical protein
MTQRKLTAEEQEVVYNLMHAINRAALLINARESATAMIDHIGGMVRNGTTDGKPPTPVERVPTAADIGRRVKVRDDESSQWSHNYRFVGFAASSRFVAQHDLSGILAGWHCCIIDEEAGQ